MRQGLVGSAVSGTYGALGLSPAVNGGTLYLVFVRFLAQNS